MGRMIAPVTRRSTQNPRKSPRESVALSVQRFLRVTFVIVIASGTVASAHDLERTRVSIVFARDGSFVADVVNDPRWLALRQESIPGPFADRVVLWVDGHEIHPSSVEFIPFDSHALAQDRAERLATYRLRGRMPADAHTLRWYYGLVIDPYPLTIRRADGRLLVEEVGGDAWSRTIDLSGQFRAPLLNDNTVGWLVTALLFVPVVLRVLAPKRSTTEDAEVKSLFVQD